MHINSLFNNVSCPEEHYFITCVKNASLCRTTNNESTRATTFTNWSDMPYASIKWTIFEKNKRDPMNYPEISSEEIDYIVKNLHVFLLESLTKNVLLILYLYLVI